jgi:hypothetical protein
MRFGGRRVRHAQEKRKTKKIKAAAAASTANAGEENRRRQQQRGGPVAQRTRDALSLQSDTACCATIDRADSLAIITAQLFALPHTRLGLLCCGATGKTSQKKRKPMKRLQWTDRACPAKQTTSHEAITRLHLLIRKQKTSRKKRIAGCAPAPAADEHVKHPRKRPQKISTGIQKAPLRYPKRSTDSRK